MKLYLSSFLQPENFGTGRLIGIANGDKPHNLNVSLTFKPFIPLDEILDEYLNLKAEHNEYAGKVFVTKYRAQLTKFTNEVLQEAKNQGIKPAQLLPFEEGDTLASWERSQYTHYRGNLVPVLTYLGYEVISN